MKLLILSKTHPETKLDKLKMLANAHHQRFPTQVESWEADPSMSVTMRNSDGLQILVQKWHIAGVEEDSSLCLPESQIPRNCPLVSLTDKAMRKPADTGTHETGP